MELKRLNKRMVELGLAESRRKADELIRSGKVSVDGKTTDELGKKVSDQNEVLVSGKSGIKRDDIYVAFNKPKGLICSHNGQGGQTIFDKLPKNFAGLKIAGRLDRDSEGLVILSSDGAFVNELIHPSRNKQKTYIVRTNQEISTEEIDKLNKGVKLEDGVSKLKVKAIKPNEVRIIMTEGRNRQIRRSLEAVGKKVISLQRIKLGNFALGSITPNEFRFIKPEDVL